MEDGVEALLAIHKGEARSEHNMTRGTGTHYLTQYFSHRNKLNTLLLTHIIIWVIVRSCVNVGCKVTHGLGKGQHVAMML